MNGRLYDPKVGRFLSPDPVLITNASQNFNGYSYCLNNPLKYTDPSGNELITAIIITSAVLIGSYTTAASVNGSFNPGKWDWGAKTWTALIAGGIIGGVSAGAGVAIGGSVSAAVLAVKGGGFVAAVAGGAAGGATGGFITGFSTTAFLGGDFGASLKAGLTGAAWGVAIGAASGAVGYGVLKGINSIRVSNYISKSNGPKAQLEVPVPEVIINSPVLPMPNAIPSGLGVLTGLSLYYSLFGNYMTLTPENLLRNPFRSMKNKSDGWEKMKQGDNTKKNDDFKNLMKKHGIKDKSDPRWGKAHKKVTKQGLEDYNDMEKHLFGEK